MRRNKDKARDYAERHGVPKCYSDAQGLIDDPDIHAVYIATPPDSHHHYALRVAKAGKACCVEKPMALNYAQCQEMNQAFASAGLPLFVAYYRRYLPRFTQVKNWIDQGLIGSVRHVDLRHLGQARDKDTEEKNWRVQPEIAGGGYFVDLASHGINLLSHMLGNIDRVYGIAKNQQQRYKAEDAVAASFSFAQGATGCGVWNFGSHHYTDQVFIAGDQGEIRFSIFDEQPITIDSSSLKESLDIPHPENVQLHHIDHMVKHLRGETTHLSLGDSAADTSNIMDQILNN